MDLITPFARHYAQTQHPLDWPFNHRCNETAHAIVAAEMLKGLRLAGL